MAKAVLIYRIAGNHPEIATPYDLVHLAEEHNGRLGMTLDAGSGRIQRVLFTPQSNAPLIRQFADAFQARASNTFADFDHREFVYLIEAKEWKIGKELTTRVLPPVTLRQWYDEEGTPRPEAQPMPVRTGPLAEAEASVALDKGEGATQAVEGWEPLWKVARDLGWPTTTLYSWCGRGLPFQKMTGRTPQGGMRMMHHIRRADTERFIQENKPRPKRRGVRRRRRAPGTAPAAAPVQSATTEQLRTDLTALTTSLEQVFSLLDQMVRAAVASRKEVKAAISMHKRLLRVAEDLSTPKELEEQVVRRLLDRLK